jgi:hypothetical protein
MLLATLAAQSLNHQALTTPPVDIVDSAHTKEAGDHVVSDPTEKQGAMKRAPNAIASPESLVAQEFSPEASPSSKLPNTQPVEDTQKVVEPTRESPALKRLILLLRLQKLRLKQPALALHLQKLRLQKPGNSSANLNPK